MQNRTLLGQARDMGERIAGMLRRAGAKRAVVAGETRRGLPLVSELTLVASGISPRAAREVLVKGAAELGEVRISGRDVESTIVTSDAGAGVRVRVVRDVELVKTLLQETGDAAHVAWLRETARAVGTTFGRATRGAESEREVYKALGLPLVPPELREGAVPTVPRDLLGEKSVRGCFHVHTDWSDGTASIVAMARAARDVGLAYVGISDHSQAASYAHGLDAVRLAEQADAIRVARRELPEITILHGVEVDVMGDGSLDLDDETLAKLDFVIASVHTRFAMSEAAMTARIVRAVSHPLVTILGHPTGRLLDGRGGYRFDMARVAAAAVANDTYLEINANAHRLDLEGATLREARDAGAMFAINPDAHAPLGFHDVPLGVMVARRAALEEGRVLNTRDRVAVAATLAARKSNALARLGVARALA